MSTVPAAATPTWFRIVALIAIGWNAVGVAMYLSSVGVFGDSMAGLSEPERAAAASIPGWITGALLVLEGWIVFFSGILEMFGLAVPVMVSIGAIILAWLASHARRRDWLT
jgi:hypothetical protein